MRISFRIFLILGKALNITTDYDKQAQDLLSRAVKLDPKLVEAWNELGECYWKNDNIKEAKNCFIGALNHQRNKMSLRNLSMVLRQELAPDRDTQISNIQQGLAYAKQAVELDPQDGQSWTVLGNAHLSDYFLISQNPKTLKLCMKAYKQAEKDLVAKNNPDLHYNKAIALKYEEDYIEALECFSKALALDPTWDYPKSKKELLLKYLQEVTDLVSLNGRMKGRRLQQMIQSIDAKYLGVNDLELIGVNLLEKGINVGKIVLGKVICSVQNEDNVPFTFCMIDKDGVCLVVTVYNLAQGKGVIIGDAVGIPEPNFSSVKINFDGKVFEFRKVRVENPLVLIVNGKKLNKNQQAGTRMTTFKKM